MTALRRNSLREAVSALGKYGSLERLDECRWRIPVGYKKGMLVDGIVFSSPFHIELALKDSAIDQVANSACLPGILTAALAMPDIHSGYGFPIGGVGATDLRDGVITPGGIGYDINCGVRVLRTTLHESDVRPRIRSIIDRIYSMVPSGVGSQGPIKLSASDIKRVLSHGAAWAVDNGYGSPSDIEFTEEAGALDGADPSALSKTAVERGMPQLGTLGSGNHFLEVQVIEEVFHTKAAEAFGLHEGQIVLMIHTGSRGLGHQVCTDYVKVMSKSVKKYGISVPDPQLACAPMDSPEGREYWSAMACAANFAWANRQCITHWVRQALSKEFDSTPHLLGMNLLYDVAHNIAKIEEHQVSGKVVKACVHRKGATRAFPPGHPDVPEAYRAVGQPVIVPGDMGRNSYILLGTSKAMEMSFGSTCHGAGRVMSRNEALKTATSAQVRESLEKAGVYAKAASKGSLQEEMPEAYKNVNEVVDVAHRAGISLKVARLRPMGVVKG